MAGKPTYAVTDTETGGLDPRTHALLQVSIIIVDDELNEMENFAHKIIPRPGYLIDPKAAEINGYNETEWLSQGIDWETADRAYAQFLEQWFPSRSCVGVAHNAQFDSKFIKIHMPLAYPKYYQLNPENPGRMSDDGWICTLQALRQWRAKTKIAGKNKLSDLIALAQYTPEGTAHEALQDTKSCLKGLQWLKKERAAS